MVGGEMNVHIPKNKIGPLPQTFYINSKSIKYLIVKVRI